MRDDGESFQIRGSTTEKARLATVDSLTGGTARRIVLADQDRVPSTDSALDSS